MFIETTVFLLIYSVISKNEPHRIFCNRIAQKLICLLILFYQRLLAPTNIENPIGRFCLPRAYIELRRYRFSYFNRRGGIILSTDMSF